MAKTSGKTNSKALPIIGPGGNERGPGNQAKAVTKSGYPTQKGPKVPANKLDQKGKMTKTHQGLYSK